MTMFKKVTKTFQWGQNTVTMETGEIARQSTGAVLLDMDGTVVLANSELGWLSEHTVPRSEGGGGCGSGCSSSGGGGDGGGSGCGGCGGGCS